VREFCASAGQTDAATMKINEKRDSAREYDSKAFRETIFFSVVMRAGLRADELLHS